MADKIGILYSTVDGQTKKICDVLYQVFKNEQIETDLYSIDAFNQKLSDYHTLIIGASVRYGKHNKSVHEFISANKMDLDKIQTAFFSVNLVARKKEKASPSTNPYMLKFLRSLEWKADFLEVFAGKLDYQSYSFWDSLMIKLIMKFTNGPTKTAQPIEYTDWEKVKAFGLGIAKAMKS